MYFLSGLLLDTSIYLLLHIFYIPKSIDQVKTNNANPD